MPDPRSPAEEHRDASNDALAAELRSEDRTYAQIAEIMGCSSRTAYMRVQRHYARMGGPGVKEAKARQLAELDDLALIAWRVLEAHHYVVITGGPKAGRIVRGPRLEGEEGGYLEDAAPVLAAMDRILGIQARRARLMGLDAPVRHKMDVITKDALTESMERMLSEIGDDVPDEVR